MFYDIIRVEALPEYHLRLTFDDGSEGELDLRSQICFTGVFEPLRDEREFRKVRVNPESGTIQWPNTGKSVSEPDECAGSVAGMMTAFRLRPHRALRFERCPERPATLLR
ncbi:MAG TPA: DUF2442 domain-containing protein [Thermoanaerobaculia bacterium]|jgi:hypothetical protein|nr:DUF2442 domain-containing protein [Thermoanaerobaculia bacterium]